VDIHIDRLRLQVTGMSPDAARELGRLLAEQLARAAAAVPPAAGPAPLTRLRVTVTAPSGHHPGTLAPAMAAEVSRVLRTVTTGAGAASTGAASTAATATAPATHPGAAR
jgi:hypothetical protein